MITGNDVFAAAMALSDEVDEATGATDTNDTKEYKQRTLLILNALLGELYPYSDTCIRAAGKRSVTPIVTDFTIPLDLDDFLAQSVMPYGLAAHLLMNEDPTAANFFQQRYNELIARYGGAIPGESEDITNLYRGLEYSSSELW